MSSNTFKVIAKAGGGGFVGVEIVKALLKLGGFEVDFTQSKGFMTRGASLHVVSYDDGNSLVDALTSVDVLISAVPAEGLTQLIKTSKASGVRPFSPNTYSGYFEYIPNHPSPLTEDKKVARKIAAEIGLPVSVFRTGAFPEYNFVPWLANVLKLHPIASLQNKDPKIEGAALSHNDVVEIWEQKHKAKLDVEYRPIEELAARIEHDSNDLLAILLDERATGHGKFRGPLNNGLYPKWKSELIGSVL